MVFQLLQLLLGYYIVYVLLELIIYVICIFARTNIHSYIGLHIWVWVTMLTISAVQKSLWCVKLLVSFVHIIHTPHACTHTRTHARTHTSMHTCTHTHVHRHTHTHKHTYMYWPCICTYSSTVSISRMVLNHSWQIISILHWITFIVTYKDRFLG